MLVVDRKWCPLPRTVSTAICRSIYTSRLRSFFPATPLDSMSCCDRAARSALALAAKRWYADTTALAVRNATLGGSKHMPNATTNMVKSTRNHGFVVVSLVDKRFFRFLFNFPTAAFTLGLATCCLYSVSDVQARVDIYVVRCICVGCGE